MNSERIVFICPTTSQPRHQRRARALIHLFKEACTICWDRGHYRENKWPAEIRQVLLPATTDKAYLQRALKFPAAISKAKQEIHSFRGRQVLYSFSLDCGLIGALCKRKGDLLFWEMGDLISTAMSNPIKRGLVEWIEKRILAKADYLVLTSLAMYEIHYPRIDPSSRQKLIIIENRLGDEFRSVGGPTKDAPSKPLRLVWSGLLRGERIYRRFLDAVGADGGKRVTLDIFGGGAGADMATEYAQKYPNITMHGSYREDPESVLNIHKAGDVQIILNDLSDINVTTQLTDRLFQSLIFETPMITCKGTENGKRVEELGVGMMIDGENEDWDKVFDLLTTTDVIEKWLKTLREYPEDKRYLDSSEIVAKVSDWLNKAN